MLCVLIKTLSHASVKKKTERLKGFVLLLVVFKLHHGSEGVSFVFGKFKNKNKNNYINGYNPLFTE